MIIPSGGMLTESLAKRFYGVFPNLKLVFQVYGSTEVYIIHQRDNEQDQKSTRSACYSIAMPWCCRFPILQWYCAFSANMMQCYCATDLLCWSSIVLQYNCSVVLMVFSTIVLQCCCAAVLLCRLCCSDIVLQNYCAAMLLCYTVLLCGIAIVLPCYCAALLLCWLCWRAIVLTVLQCYCVTVLQCFCVTVLLCFSVPVLQCHRFNSVTDLLTYRATTRGPSGPKNSAPRLTA